MTLIPKSIASDTVMFQKLQYKIMYGIGMVFVGLFCVVACIASQSLWVFLLAILFIVGFHVIAFNGMKKHVLILAEEVKTAENGLWIRKDKVSELVAYDNIQAIDYFYSIFVVKNNVVELTFVHPTTLGKKVRFISWADSSNYNREFRLNPMIKTPETLTWVQMIKEKANL